MMVKGLDRTNPIQKAEIDCAGRVWNSEQIPKLRFKTGLGQLVVLRLGAPCLLGVLRTEL
jgi:hypothetical protein